MSLLWKKILLPIAMGALPGAVAGYYYEDLLLPVLQTDDMRFIYTTLTEPFFLRLRMAGLFALTGAVIVAGVVNTTIATSLKRALLIGLSATTAGFIAIMLKKASMARAGEVSASINAGSAGIFLSDAGFETIPIAALSAAALMALYLILKQRQSS